MRSIASLPALFGLFLNIGFAQVNPTPSLQPTRLEALAGQPTAKVTWSNEVGRIDSAEAHAVVTALVVEDQVEPPHRMGGIRIDLSTQTAMDQIYLDDVSMEDLKKDLDEIASYVEYFRNKHVKGSLGYLGSCRLRQSSPTAHTLSAAFYIAPDSSGLSLSAFKGQELGSLTEAPHNWPR
jgi:hypothetical protein